MSKVFITGDRTPGPLYTPLVAVEMLRAVAQGLAISTGENGGVEEMVREYGRLAGVEVTVRPGTKADFNERALSLKADAVPAVVIHTDPGASSVYTSLAAHLEDDDMRLVTHMDLLV